MADATWATALITAASGLLGTFVGGGITYWTQSSLQRATEHRLRKSLAAALGAEIEAHLNLMVRRSWEKTWRARVAELRKGVDWKSGGPGTLGFGPDEKPLDRFPFFQSHMASVGLLGPVCTDVAKFYSMMAGVGRTVINAERRAFDSLSPDRKADLIESELAVWADALALGGELVKSLGKIAGKAADASERPAFLSLTGEKRRAGE